MHKQRGSQKRRAMSEKIHSSTGCRSTKQEVQNGGHAVPHPHVLGRTATRYRVPWGPVPGRWCGPSRVYPRREGGKLENLAKIVSAARVVQAAVPVCECS